jgi:hypothetical protein
MMKKLGVMPQAACYFQLALCRGYPTTSLPPYVWNGGDTTGVAPLFGKELMGIKSDKVYGRYT